jgi:N-formylglutamate amidohydrolase
MEKNYQFYDGTSHVLIHAPHGGKRIPELAYGSLVIDEVEIRAELLAMTDSYTDQMALDISAHALAYGTSKKNSAVFRNHNSRLVVDPERFPDEREEMNAVGMGAVYTHGSRRQPIRVENSAIAQRLIKLYFEPYANSLEYQVDGLLKRFNRATIVDLHSYASIALPYELHSEGDRPQICLGFDDFHVSPGQIKQLTEIFEQDGYEVSQNTPFSGTYVPLKHYGSDARVSSVMLEIRRDMYMDEFTGELIKDKYQRLVFTLAKAVDFLNK